MSNVLANFFPRAGGIMPLVLPLLVMTGLAEGRAVAQTGETSGFTVDSSGRPISAATVFYTPSWLQVDAVKTAQHELLHGIGYSVQYPRFASHVSAARGYHLTSSDQSRLLAKLTPANQGTHVNPSAGTVDGTDQSTGVMQPTAALGPRMGAQDKNVLQAGFAWATPASNIKIEVAFSGSFSVQEKKIIQDAATAAETLMGSDRTGHMFTWTVSQKQGFAGPGVTTGKADVRGLVDRLGSSGPEGRRRAIAAFLDNPDEAAAALRSAGARPMAGLTPSLRDVAYSIVSGDRPGLYRTSSFGVTVAPGTTRAQLVEIGRRAGFTVDEDRLSAPGAIPSSYVTLRAGVDLWEAIARTIVEPAIIGVNLNHIER